MQLLAGLGLSLGQLRRSRQSKATAEIVNEMEALLGEAQGELRAIAYLAHPPQLSELGFVRAVTRLAEGFGRRSALASSLVACLELARIGRIELSQARPFAPIMVRRRA